MVHSGSQRCYNKVRFTSYKFEVEGKKPFKIHPPFLYNSVKTEAKRQGEELGKIVLDTEWWREAKIHIFTLTTQNVNLELEEIVKPAVQKWEEMLDTDAEIKEYKFKEISPLQEAVPDGVDAVLIETRSPVMFGFRTKNGERRYAEPRDMGNFVKINLQLVRRYKELYGKMENEKYEQVKKYSKKPENVMYYFKYTDNFPLRMNKSLKARKAMEGKTLFRHSNWNKQTLKLLRLAEIMHIGQKTGYGMGGVNVSFLKQVRN